MSNGITVNWLRGKYRNKNEVLSDGGSRGSGRLVARRRPNGALFYYVYSNEAGKDTGFPLGPFCEKGISGLTLPAAREQAGKLAQLYRSGVKDIKGHVEAEAAEKERLRKAAEAERLRAEEQKRSSTLKQLCDAYINFLRAKGKQCTRDAQNIFENHVFKAAPDLAAKRASDVTSDEFVELLGRLLTAGKGRTAGKLRSGLRAAYAMAIRARLNPEAAAAGMRVFGITSNPVSDIASLTHFIRPRERHLTAPELGHFLRRLDNLPADARRDALQLTLLLGGQRPTQLLRVQARDVDLSADTVTLMDTKGARRQPRVHVLPLVQEAHAILARRLDALQVNEPVFSLDQKTSMRPETLGGAVAEISEQMVKAKEVREPFQLRDLRRTAETMLASLGVSSDVRAQLQSHGLGGIQTRHYDKHSYALEKAAALEQWAKHLARLKAGEKGTVVKLPKKAAHRA